MANFSLVFIFVTLFLSARAITNEHGCNPLIAVKDLFDGLRRPEQLKGWKAAHWGDPCGESWIGNECFGSSVINIHLHGLKLTGSLGSHLAKLYSLKTLDVSLNNISGDIPYGLPPNMTCLNLSHNNFSMSIPRSVSYLTNLTHLNLSHNALCGPIDDVFVGLRNLKEMDLSYNQYSGHVPHAFSYLTNLTLLYLQNNNLTGSVVYLSDLQLIDLDIQNNHFSGNIHILKRIPTCVEEDNETCAADHQRVPSSIEKGHVGGLALCLALWLAVVIVLYKHCMQEEEEQDHQLEEEQDHQLEEEHQQQWEEEHQQHWEEEQEQGEEEQGGHQEVPQLTAPRLRYFPKYYRDFHVTRLPSHPLPRPEDED